MGFDLGFGFGLWTMDCGLWTVDYGAPYHGLVYLWESFFWELFVVRLPQFPTSSQSSQSATKIRKLLEFFLSNPGRIPGVRSMGPNLCLSLLIELRFNWCDSILIDDAKMVILSTVVLQICNKCKWHHLAIFATNARNCKMVTKFTKTPQPGVRYVYGKETLGF